MAGLSLLRGRAGGLCHCLPARPLHAVAAASTWKNHSRFQKRSVRGTDARVSLLPSLHLLRIHISPQRCLKCFRVTFFPHIPTAGGREGGSKAACPGRGTISSGEWELAARSRLATRGSSWWGGSRTREGPGFLHPAGKHALGRPACRTPSWVLSKNNG